MTFEIGLGDSPKLVWAQDLKEIDSSWWLISEAKQLPFWNHWTHSHNSALIMCHLCSPCWTLHALSGVLSSAQLSMRDQTSFVWANNITDYIKECNKVPVATKEWRRRLRSTKRQKCEVHWPLASGSKAIWYTTAAVHLF